MLLPLALFAFTLFLAYANGANDNFKGVATLFGSGSASYKTALAWATITTLAGSLLSVVIAHKLIAAFSGKGLVTTETAADPTFLLAVAIAAGLTVMIATITGFPISTTHSLIGALVGAGLVGSGSQLNFSALSQSFMAPLLLSPLMAVALSAGLYVVFRALRTRMGVTKEFCLCVGKTLPAMATTGDQTRALSEADISVQAGVAKTEDCRERYQGSFLGIEVERLLDISHFLSAGLVSFARGLNDTPKIMGLALVAGLLDIQFSMILIATAMAIGGILNARKVAYVMSKDITELNHGQGFTANLVTSVLVVFASKWGLPVSTTHVSVGSLFGIGLINGKADNRVIGKILASWALTLPLSALLAALAFLAFQSF